MIETPIYFNGKDLAPLLLVENVSRKIVSSRNITATEIPGVDGSLVTGTTLAPLEVTVTAVILRDEMRDVSEARQLLAEALYTDEAAPLFLPDEPNRYLMALYEGGAEPDRLMNRPEVELTFYCADPVMYGERRSVEVTGRRAVPIRGTYKAAPKVTVKPPAGESWRITKASTGDFVEVSADFTGEQEVVLDMALERCTINGLDSRVEEASDFFTLLGTEELEVSGGTAKLEWVERWL